MELADLPDQQMIWKYMSYGKFSRLLERQSLFFCRIDQYPDSFEGSLGYINYLQRKYATLNNEQKIKRSILENKKLKTYYLANCWHISDDENLAMWQNFGREGLAVQTTAERLKTSIICQNLDLGQAGSSRMRTQQAILKQFIHFGKVSYVDYVKEHIEEISFKRFFYKDQSYAYEQEYRILMNGQEMLAQYGQNFGQQLQFPYKGLDVSCCLPRLIEKVILFPLAPDSLARKVELRLKQAGLNPDLLLQSHLNPFF